MGDRIEVFAWVEDHRFGDLPGPTFYDRQVYGGGSLTRALLTAARWRCGCVTIKWRHR